MLNMNLQIDTENKIITLMEDTKLGDLLDFIVLNSSEYNDYKNYTIKKTSMYTIYPTYWWEINPKPLEPIYKPEITCSCTHESIH